VSGRREAWVALALLGLAAIALLAIEVAKGGPSYGQSTAVDPCQARAPYPGEGFDATLQRVVLDGLDAAACKLGTTREELVLSFDPSFGVKARWDRATVERAVRAGLLGAVDDAEKRGSLGGLEAVLLREVIRRAPIELLLEGGIFPR
jgi:hypothetical protein